ncbi:hypothetical protein PV08_09643 [Exophiala spinifera]|uniref:Carboxylic ester hydrolase n=1 Tax=Exophiala spinifera TaxID=91928 RepID=A0A0D1YBQ5_9EURO|nr:uncharacterized protein PV08_09643 [Exophiala spinifera]KIW12366.1 hypothetical protein PV08_09643 [Exophiala spinifera]
MESAQVNLGTPCSQLVAPSLHGAEVLQISAAEVHNYSFPPVRGFNMPGVSDVAFCNVTASLRHTGADDTVYVYVWLPLKDWNGRYQATGGGGLAAGMGPLLMSGQVADGYAVSSTDGGLTKNQTVDPQSGLWALRDDGSLDEALSLNLAWRSIHDMAVVSKDVVRQFYGTEPKYSYWNGCSQGGRQGYAAAAKYPHDFDGILAVAPAIDFVDMVPSDYYPPVVLRNAEEVPPECIFPEYQAAIIEACDTLDGVADGLISSHESLEACSFDPDTLVGKTITCGEDCLDRDPFLGWVHVPCRKTSELTITPAHADIVRKILAGPHTTAADGDGNSRRLWYGLAPGADFDVLARVALIDNGTHPRREVVPFAVAENWLKYFALQDPSYDMAAMTHEDYVAAHELSVARLGPLWGNQNLDLAAFRQSGNKLLTWFGLADQYITPFGMIRYREGVEEKFGGPDAVDEWYRLFFAPGVGHCAGGVGPNPVNPLGALVSWVEQGKAPDVLAAAKTTEDGVHITRDLCRFPKKLVYAKGDVNEASSFICSEEEEGEEKEGGKGGEKEEEGGGDGDSDGTHRKERHEEL